VVEKGIVSNGKEMKQQFLVYFVSEVLTGSERFCSEMENICYAILMSALQASTLF
jgi:hypothetical protein